MSEDCAGQVIVGRSASGQPHTRRGTHNLETTEGLGGASQGTRVGVEYCGQCEQVGKGARLFDLDLEKKT